MSKQNAIKKAMLKPVEDIRFSSIIQIKNDFANNNIPKEGKNYDLTIYTDSNGDIFYPYIFSKTLEHDPVTGFAKKVDIDRIFNALTEGTSESVEAIQQSSTATRKLEGVIASSSFNLIGTDTAVFGPSAFLPLASEGGAFEMAEVYGRSLLRDVAFNNYINDELVGLIANDLDQYTDKTSHPLNQGSITSTNIFRGNSHGEDVGPYISQLLYRPFEYGNITVNQQYKPESDYIPASTRPGWLAIQNGQVNGQIVQGDAKYIYNGRVLGSAVHKDPLYQFYYNAALILLQTGVKPTGISSAKSSGWTSGGGPNILASVAHVCQGALRCAWNSKWNLAMKIRPEVYAQRLQLAEDPNFDHTNVPGLAEIANMFRSGIKNRVKNASADGSVYLSLLYPEGSPTHPSHPAGHAVVAGACTTILKAMFVCHDTDETTRKLWVRSAVPNSRAVHSIDGTALDDFTDPSGAEMTIVGELNKLASNVALGRDFAGVHYRCDGHCGKHLGEKFAITYLMDMAKELHESQNGAFNGWLLEKFDGSRIKIKHDIITTLE